MSFKKKGFSKYIFLLIILIGIAVALFLIRNPQVFAPKAQETANDQLIQFTLNQPTASCLNGRPTVTLNWTGVTDGFHSPDQTINMYFGSGFSYEVLYRENGGPEIHAGSAKYNLTYQLSTLDGLQPGHAYGFLVSARSPSFGPVYGNRAWSDGIYGWLTIPTNCGPFTTNSPTPTSPSPSPQPSLSPSHSPSSSPNPADLDNVGGVTVQDFNLFVQYFAANDLRGDLNHNGGIDIQDFNEFVRLFRLANP